MVNPATQTLIIGGTGKTGRRIARILKEKGYQPRIASRTSTVRFDWQDVSTWTAALRNIDQVYISFQPDLAMSGAVKKIKTLTEFAVHHRIQKLVLLSGRGETEAQECEQLIVRSTLNYTIVRASWFFQNFSEGNFLEPIRMGHLALPAGSVREPFVDADDIAEIAVAALTSDDHNGRIYDVTGPRLLTFEQAVNEISQATGKPIRYERISMDDYSSLLTGYAIPGEIVSLITYLFTEVLDGRNEMLSSGVEDALGKKSRDFSQFVAQNAAAGVW